MNVIEEMKEKRFRFLRRLWELTGGDESELFSMFKIGEELGFDKDLTVKIEQYFYGERLINHRLECGTRDREIGISHWGVRAVEEALSNPGRPTHYFPPVINIGDVKNSQIQIGSHEAIQVATFNENRYEELKEVIQSLKESIDQLNIDQHIDQQQMSKLQADIQTIEEQISSSKPKATIITGHLDSIKRILEGAAGNAIASGLLIKIVALLG